MQLDETSEALRALNHAVSTFGESRKALFDMCEVANDAHASGVVHDLAWQLLRDVFLAWDAYESELISDGISPSDLIQARLVRLRERPEFEEFGFANFPDASRLLNKVYPVAERLERVDEENPGAPPGLSAVYERTPAARGPVPERLRRFVEVLDAASLRLSDLDVVHARTISAVNALVPRITNRRGTRENFTILDVSCSGSHLARHLSTALHRLGFTPEALQRVHVLGIDVDPRASSYTFTDGHGLGWNERGTDVAVTVHRGNLMSEKSTEAIQAWLAARETSGFDAVVALGILDYFDCPLPGAEGMYLPERLAPAFGALLRRAVAPGGLLIATVFAEEWIDAVGRGARHGFANWHLRYASKTLMQRRFPFLRDEEMKRLDGLGTTGPLGAHFIVHRC